MPVEEEGPPPSCSENRIRKIYAIPANLPVPQSTTVEVETYPDAFVGRPRYTFEVRINEETPGEAVLAEMAVTCALDSAACRAVACVGVANSTEVDSTSGLPSAFARVQVTVDDDECRDRASLWIRCLRASDAETCSNCKQLIDANLVEEPSSPKALRTLLKASGAHSAVTSACLAACFP